MANTYEYTGQYPGLVGSEWKVDFRDGHIYIAAKDTNLLGNFPDDIIIHFMPTEKAFNAGKVDMTDELFTETFKFNKMMGQFKPSSGERLYYETRVGDTKFVTAPNTIPVDQPILSLVLTDKANKPFAIINLRHYIAIPKTRNFRVTLSCGVRYAMYGAKTVKHGDTGSLLNSYVSASYRCYFVNIAATQDGTLPNAAYFTEAKWAAFKLAYPDETKWPELVAFNIDALPFPAGIKNGLATGVDAPATATLKGKWSSTGTDPIGVKAMLLPFFNGVGMVVEFIEVKLLDDTIKRPVLNIFPEQALEFAYTCDFIGVNR